MDQSSLQQAIEYFKKTLGDSAVLTGANDLDTYGRDWTKIFDVNPGVVVLPSTTAEVAKIVRYCAEKKLAIVPSGGRTGLAGGAVASHGEVVLSLQRMNKIEKIDAIGLTACVQAGVTTQQLQDAAKEVGLFFPLDLAAKGSCHIGGNIATNAGGVKFIRFGGMREQVLGLEVVLPNGDVLDLNSSLRKNNTGYDLKQLFIASEGTLGIVTRATVRLTAPPRNMQVAIMGVETFEAIPRILQAANLQSVPLTAFEFFTEIAHEIVLKHARGARTPFERKFPFYVLLEAEEAPGGGKVMEPLLESLFEHGLVQDAVVAQNPTQHKEFWGLRENITESIAAHGHARKNDISLAIDQLGAFLADLGRELASSPTDGMEIVLFGHIGDGNLHINYVGSKSEDVKAFNARARAVEERVFKLLQRYKGSVSAEHGIGLLKKKDLLYSRTAAEVAWMRKIKAMFDPAGIMNPGKIFD